MKGDKMTKREITSLVLKLIGIYIVVSFVGYLPISLIALTTTYLKDSTAMSCVFVLLTLLYLLFCILIIIYSNRVAGWIIHEDNTVELPDSISKDDVMAIAFCCMGLLIMTNAIPKLLSMIPQYIVVLGNISEYLYAGKFWQHITRLVAPLIQFILGLFLFIRTKGLVKLWHRIRE